MNAGEMLHQDRAAFAAQVQCSMQQGATIAGGEWLSGWRGPGCCQQGGTLEARASRFFPSLDAATHASLIAPPLPPQCTFRLPKGTGPFMSACLWTRAGQGAVDLIGLPP